MPMNMTEHNLGFVPLNELRYGLKSHAFIPCFQPLITQGGELYGVEVLARWHHPQRGLLFPGRFMPAIRASNLSGELLLCVLEQVYEEIKKLLQVTHSIFHISFNLDASACRDKITTFLIEHFLPQFESWPVRFICELTERERWKMSLMQLDQLNRLRHHNVLLALDDFGTGFANLDLLAWAEPDIIKLDTSFVRSIDKTQMSWRYADIVLDIAEKLNMLVLAEGVETEWQWSWLKSRKVRLFQGNYFSPPLFPSAFVDWFFHNNHCKKLKRSQPIQI